MLLEIVDETLQKLRPGLLGLWAALVVASSVIQPGLGQTPFGQPSATPSILTSIAVDYSNKERMHIVLHFDAVAPKYTMAGDNTDKPTVAFALTTPGSAINSPTNLHDLLSTMSLDQTGTFLIAHLAGSQPVHLTVNQTDARTIVLEVSKAQGGPLAPANSFAAPSGSPLPQQSDPAPEAANFEIVPLKYADVSEVVGILADGQTVKPNDTFTPHEPAFGSAGMAGSSSYSGFNATPAPQSFGDRTDEPVGQSVTDTIAIDRRLNAIILRGTPDRIARFKQLIALIDTPVQSVVLETMFVELSSTGARNLGLNFNNSSGQIAVANWNTGAFNTSTISGGKSLASASLQAALYAQVQEGRARIISRPSISALSGATAKIVTGDALPILTSIALSGVNGVSQQVQYVNVGVTLQIAPRISGDGNVTSHIFCVVSSVAGFNQGYPTISQREAQTSATVRDGETFVIGGLTQDNTSRGTSHLPGLSNVPLLGGLFDYHTDSDSKSELYIVVTPHIVKRTDVPPAAVAQEIELRRLSR